jgi:sortase (surface protein transpeptidase)
MRARFEGWWGRRTPIQRGLALVVPAIAITVAAISAGACGGGGDSEEATPTATEVLATRTRLPSRTPNPTPTVTPEPVNAGLQGGDYSGSSSGGGGGGGGAPLRPGATLTGPGPITGTDMSISIPRLGVNATVYGRTVGTNGQMGNPAGAYDVIWYDFSPSFVGLGGRPGEAGANVVLAGHVDYIGVGPAVFWSIRDLVPGDIITVRSSAGTFNYAVQWNQWADPYSDFTQFVRAGGPDSVTLVTCIGGFSGGHYSNRIVVRATRV